MLDHEPVKVHHIKRAVRTGVEIHGPEPGVGRSQELDVRMCALGDEGSTRIRKQVLVGEVVHGLRDE